MIIAYASSNLVVQCCVVTVSVRYVLFMYRVQGKPARLPVELLLSVCSESFVLVCVQHSVCCDYSLWRRQFFWTRGIDLLILKHPSSLLCCVLSLNNFVGQKWVLTTMILTGPLDWNCTVYTLSDAPNLGMVTCRGDFRKWAQQMMRTRDHDMVTCHGDFRKNDANTWPWHGHVSWWL